MTIRPQDGGVRSGIRQCAGESADEQAPDFQKIRCLLVKMGAVVPVCRLPNSKWVGRHGGTHARMSISSFPAPVSMHTPVPSVSLATVPETMGGLMSQCRPRLTMAVAAFPQEMLVSSQRAD